MKIRVMQQSDYPAVYALWLATPGMGLNDVDDSPEGIAKFLARNPHTCFVAETEGEMDGVIMCGHDGRRAFIYHLAVARHKQRRGIGRALLDAAMQALENEGIAKAALVVFTRNTQGNAFWEKCGFAHRPDLTYRNRAIRDMVRIDT